MVPDWDSPVVLVFDERVSEQEIDAAVRVSPRTSEVVVDHSGDELRVSLREGWERGVVYHVTVLPTVSDLFGNERAEPVTLVFSTGPEIPATFVGVSVVDRITGEPEPAARVELIRDPDSLVYAAAPDSAGRVELAHLPTGRYLARAFLDRDLDLALDDLEPRDTAVVRIAAGDTARVEMAIVEPDSTGPRLASATVVNGILELRFDDFLDPTPPVAPRVEVRGADGDPIPVAEIRVGSLGAAEPATADTTARLPSQSLMVRLDESAELRAGETYEVSAGSVVNVVSLVGGGAAEFTGPEATTELDNTSTDTLGVGTLRPRR